MGPHPSDAGGEGNDGPETHALFGHCVVDHSRERVKLTDRPWPGPPVTKKIIDTHQVYIMWCYAYCRETEHETAWFVAEHFVMKCPSVPLPRDREAHLQGIGINIRPERCYPIAHFFFNVKELIAREDSSSSPEVDLQCFNATQTHLDTQLSIPEMIFDSLRNWIDAPPKQVLFASEVVTFRRGQETFNRKLWQIDVRDLELIQVYSFPIHMNFLRGPEFLSG